MEIKEDTYEEPVFAPDYIATVLEAKMCTNYNEHSMNISFLWCLHNKLYPGALVGSKESLSKDLYGDYIL